MFNVLTSSAKQQLPSVRIGRTVAGAAAGSAGAGRRRDRCEGGDAGAMCDLGGGHHHEFRPMVAGAHMLVATVSRHLLWGVCPFQVECRVHMFFGTTHATEPASINQCIVRPRSGAMAAHSSKCGANKCVNDTWLSGPMAWAVHNMCVSIHSAMLLHAVCVYVPNACACVYVCRGRQPNGMPNYL